MTLNYQTKVYMTSGGDEQVIASGGEQKAKSGGTIRLESGAKLLDEQAAGGSQAAVLFHHDIVLAHVAGAAATTGSLTFPDKMQIIDVIANKVGGGSSSTTALTVQLKTSTGGNLTDAINVKQVRGTNVRAAQVQDALSVIAAGGGVKAVRAGSNGTTAAGVNIAVTVRVIGVKRS